MAPHRETSLTRRCSRCDKVETSCCVRCERPACDQHKPRSGRRCDECEADRDHRLAAIEPLALKDGLKGAGKLIGATAIGSAAFFGGITLLAGVVAAMSGVASILSVLGFSAAVALAFGVFGAVVFSVLALPFVGIAGTVAGTQATRRKLEAWKFDRERPGHKRLPGR